MGPNPVLYLKAYKKDPQMRYLLFSEAPICILLAAALNSTESCLATGGFREHSLQILVGSNRLEVRRVDKLLCDKECD